MRWLRDEEQHLIEMSIHELRSPLTALSWIFQELSKPNLTEAERAELVRLGALAAEKFKSIIESFSDMVGNKYSYQFQTIELLSLIGRVVEGVEPLAKKHGVNFHLYRPRAHLSILGDPIRLALAFSTILTNAIKYNRRGGSVAVCIRPLLAKRQIEISIEDTGVGIAPQEKEKLFTKQKGLGLYLARKIIAAHGGKIAIHSVPNKGTVVKIILPTHAGTARS